MCKAEKVRENNMMTDNVYTNVLVMYNVACMMMVSILALAEPPPAYKVIIN